MTTHADNTAARAIVLVGFMGAGKTSVGRALAERLGCRFVDLDDLIVARAGKPVAAIFAESGETCFRQAEARELALLLAETTGPLVLSLGGGAFVAEANRAALRRARAVAVHLAAPLEELRRRIGDAPERPLAHDAEKFRLLFEERRQAYALADLTIETLDKAVDEVAAEVIEQLAAMDSAAEWDH